MMTLETVVHWMEDIRCFGSVLDHGARMAAYWRADRLAPAAAVVPAAARPAPSAATSAVPSTSAVAAAPAIPAPPPAVALEPLPAVPVPQPPVPEAASTAQPTPRPVAQPEPRPPQAAANQPAGRLDPAPAPSAAVTAEPDPASEEEAGRDTLAGLETRVAALAADLTEIAAQVARLQPAGAADTPVAAAEPGQPAAEDSDPLQVSIEEIDAGQPADSGSPAPTNALAEAAAHDSHPAPMIRLVPIADEQDAPSTDTAAGAATEGAEEEVHAEAPPHDASPGPSPDVFRNDVRAVLAYLDQLLDDLPPERVREFAQSPQFATYKALFAELGLDDE